MKNSTIEKAEMFTMSEKTLNHILTLAYGFGMSNDLKAFKNPEKIKVDKVKLEIIIKNLKKSVIRIEEDYK